MLDAAPRHRSGSLKPVDVRRAEVIYGIRGEAMQFQLRDRPLADLLIVSGARSIVGSEIVDRTGLTGRFDIDITFVPPSTIAPERAQLGLPFGTAVADQLGLRLDRQRAAVGSLSTPPLQTAVCSG